MNSLSSLTFSSKLYISKLTRPVDLKCLFLTLLCLIWKKKWKSCSFHSLPSVVSEVEISLSITGDFLFRKVEILFCFLIFYWSTVDFQCCVSFRCTAKGLSYTYMRLFFSGVLSLFAYYKILSSPYSWLSVSYSGAYSDGCWSVGPSSAQAAEGCEGRCFLPQNPTCRSLSGVSWAVNTKTSPMQTKEKWGISPFSPQFQLSVTLAGSPSPRITEGNL